MRGRSSHSRFRLYATLVLSLAMLAHLPISAWVFIANAGPTSDDYAWGKPSVSLGWCPTWPATVFFFILPAVLFLAVVIVAGSYRRGFLAGVSLAMACLISGSWIATCRRAVTVGVATDLTNERLMQHTHWAEARSARGGIQLQLQTVSVTYGSAGKPVEGDRSFAWCLTLQSFDSVPKYPFRIDVDLTRWWPDTLHPIGFEVATLYRTGRHSYNYDRSITIPYWFPLLFCSLFPTYWLYRRLRPRPTDLPDHCQKCGYDLRAHNPGTKCPECGTPVPASPSPP